MEEDRILLTLDRDFGELVFFHGHQPPPAIVYFRFGPLSADEPGQILLRLLENTTIELTSMTNVVARAIIRQRPFPGAST